MIGGRQVRIETPEGIAFSVPVAGPLTRAAAMCIDAIVTAAASSMAMRLLTAARVISDDVAAALGILGYFVISMGYGFLLEWRWRGQTVGKRVLHLRVMDSSGLRLRFEQIVLRNVLRAVDMLPFLYLVGGSAAMFTRRGQRLGDVVANTIVVRLPDVAVPQDAQARRGHYNSLLGWDAGVSRLRMRVTPGAAALAIEALSRRDELDPGARVRLFAELASYFRSIAPFPEEATAPLSDEQYVRNVAEIVAGGGSGKYHPTER
jgi:uncharacterized RDD family membrane protein YckC